MSATGVDSVRDVVAATGISKTFAARVLHDVTLNVRAGEVHALLGGNGSGKSTFIKVLAGVYRADHGGHIRVGDVTASAEGWSAAMAKEAGLHFVHQDPAVFPSLSVAENIAIGRGFATRLAGRVDWRTTRVRAAAVIERFHIQASPDTLVAALRPADRTLVAIARALQDQENAGDGVLVLDEPTASLPVAEVDVLLDALRRYRDAGQTIVYVSHRLGEVLDLADRVTVLRDGVSAGTHDVEGLEATDLVTMIAGRSLENAYPAPGRAKDPEVVLRVRGLRAGPLTGVDLDVHRGEVLGVAGLLGSGRSEMLHALFGDLPIESGDVELDGQRLVVKRPRNAMDAGLALVPEDRGSEGIFGGMSVRSNLSAAVVGSYWRRGRLRHRHERSDARRLIQRFDVKPQSESVAAGTLSGGNQQKVVFGRWLRRSPRVLLLDEPTQGVDVNARAEIYEHVREAADAGAAVLLVTSDFEEMALVADRVVVLRDGRIVGEVVAPHISAERLTELSYLALGVPA